jgi:hypothetical protein
MGRGRLKSSRRRVLWRVIGLKLFRVAPTNHNQLFQFSNEYEKRGSDRLTGFTTFLYRDRRKD